MTANRPRPWGGPQANLNVVSYWTVSLCAVLALLTLAQACSSDPTPTATPPNTPVPVSTKPPTSAPTPTLTPTLVFTPTIASTTPPTAPPTPTPVVSTPPVGQHGGSLTSIALADFPHFDVQQESQETLTALGPGIVYSRLLRLRSGPADLVPQPHQLLECDLCQAWRVTSDNPLEYRFTLRDGVRWHDLHPVGGRELTAQDVVFSYERQKTEGFSNSSILRNMESVAAESDRTLLISVNPGFPDADFLAALADGHSKIVVPEAVELNGDLINGPVIGTGPWIWDEEESISGVASVLNRNPDYFEESLPFLDRLTFIVVKDGVDVQLAAFLTGQVQLLRVPPQGWDRLLDSGVEFGQTVSRQSGAGLILAMNQSRPPFDDEMVRKAVLKAVDPWNYADDIWKGQGIVTLGVPVVESDWLLDQEEMRACCFADPSGAEALLASLGISLPVRFNITIADFGGVFLQQAERLEQDLKGVGLEPSAELVAPEEFAQRVFRRRAYQMALGFIPPSTTPNGFLFPLLYGADDRNNLVSHADADLDALIVEQAAVRELAERGEILRSIQRRLLDGAYIFSPVTGSIGAGEAWVFHPSVQGFHPNTALSEYFFWAATWLEP